MMKACVAAAGLLLLAAEASAFVPTTPLAMASKGRSQSLSLRMQGAESPASLSRRALLSGVAGAAVLGAERVNAADKGKDSKPIILESGLAYVDKNKRSGMLANVEQAVGEGTFVIVDYVAYLRDGTIFDNTKKRGKPAAFQIGKKQVIPGLEQGMVGMRSGEERQLFIPAKLGYGSRGVCLEGKGCLVPPDTDLVYDVTLIRVAPPPI